VTINAGKPACQKEARSLRRVSGKKAVFLRKPLRMPVLAAAICSL